MPTSALLRYSLPHQTATAYLRQHQMKGESDVMIEVKNLTKHYGDKKAVNGISFTAYDGEILGLLGLNGAGKSTTMNMIAGYISMTEGSVKINGIDILENPLEARRQVGYLPEQPPLYPEMTVREYLRFVCELKGVADYKKSAEELAAATGLSDVFTRRIGNLSKGYKQRAGIAAAIAGNPSVIILDEPTVGLDPNQIIEIRELIRSLGKNHTVILSSHILHEISEICSRIFIIKNGEIAAEDTPQHLSSETGDIKRVIIRAEGSDEEIAAVLNDVEDIEFKKNEKSGEYEISSKTDDLSKRLFFAFACAGVPITSQREGKRTLEDVFKEVTKEET